MLNGHESRINILIWLQARKPINILPKKTNYSFNSCRHFEFHSVTANQIWDSFFCLTEYLTFSISPSSSCPFLSFFPCLSHSLYSLQTLVSGSRMLLQWLFMQSGLLSLTVRDIQYPARPRCQLTLPASPLPPNLFSSSLLLSSIFPPECLAKRHAVSQHPALNEKGLLKFIRGWRLWDPAGLPATFLPFQLRTGETEQREQPFIWGFLWTPSPFSRPRYPWISHSAKKDHQPDRARCIWRGNRVHNNSIPEGHPSLPAPGNRVPRSGIMGIQHSSAPHTQQG